MDAAIVFLPLLGAFLAGFFGKALGDRGAQFITCAFLVVSAILALIVFRDVALAGQPRVTELVTWISSGGLEITWALRVDTLTAVMLIVVTLVSTVVHIYSVGYMAEDRSIPRFMSYLSFFTFAMLMLVTSDNLVQMFFGWEGVGLASYLLIGFWYEKPSACAAAIKAFLVNRVGDIGFALGIAGIFLLFGTVDLSVIFAGAEGMAGQTVSLFGIEGDALTIICILLFIGACGKSAQLGLHTWLPDAMEGPTPVSALIHAATMVTAGVFMVCRLSPIFEYAPVALQLVTYVGAATAFFAASIGLVQNDIKRVIAYSTCSQLGYMFFAAGVSAYSAAMFHLVTHAFFKSLLFLGAGCVITAMHHEQDMRRMGGLWRRIPVTYAFMWVGSLALAGIGIPGLFGFAGFYSKDMILEAAYGAHNTQGLVAYWLGVAAAVMTAFYAWRLLYLTFHGQPKMPAVASHAHEPPRAMLWPLWILVAGATFAGLLLYPYFVGEERQAFWGDSLFALRDAIEDAHHVPDWVKWLPLAAGLSGILVATLAYLWATGLPQAAARALRPLYLFLLNKWYFDELYDRLFVRPALFLAQGLWQGGDQAVIDGVGPDGVAAAARNLARRAGRLQSGYLYHYAFAMLIGVVVIVTWYIIARLG